MVSIDVRRTGLWLAVLAVSYGCAVDPVDLTGKACPCPTSFQCVAGRCVPGNVDGGAPLDAEVDARLDAGPSAPACGSPGTFRLAQFQAGWRTESALDWRWMTAPDAQSSDLLHYTLVVGPDAPSVEECACALARGDACGDGLRVLDETTHPELAHDTRSNQTGGREPVRSTVSTGLRPDTVYAAALLAFDTTGGVSRSAVALNRTTRPALRALTIFENAAIARGYTIPACFDRSEEGYGYQISCPPPTSARGGCRTDEDPCPTGSLWPGSRSDDWLCEREVHPEHQASCWVTLRWQDLALPLEGAIPAGAFDEAYLEIALAMEGSPANYGEVFIGVLDVEGGGGATWGLRTGELAIRAGGVEHVYQIPLRVLTREDGAALDWVHLSAGTLNRVSVGAIFSHGTSIQVSRIVLRY